MFIRLAWLQILSADQLRLLADDQYLSEVPLYPYRGIIYDRTGRPLTENLGDWVSIGIKPNHVTYPINFARDLSKVTGKPSKGFITALRKQKEYVVLARQVSPQQTERLSDLGWKFSTQPEIHRLYPHKNLAGQVLGFVDIDNMGISGLESAFDRLLKGHEGYRVYQLDVAGNQHIDSKLPFKLQQNGGDLFTTLDISLQAILEAELTVAYEYYNARNIAGLIMHPRSGEILAMASLPGFDPNSPKDSPTGNQRNIPVTDILEPGSTFKVIPAALLLEKQLASPDDTVDCGNGRITLHGKPIRDWHSFDKLSFRDVIVNSSNIGMVRLTENLSRQDFYSFICDFGFLGRTGIEIEGEVAGSMPKVENWSGLTLPNVVYGQGIAVTLLQLASAYGCIANDGFLVRPTLVRATRTPDGKVHRQETLTIRSPISKSTADTLTSFLVEVMERGTGKAGFIKGIDIAGKTGTSQLVNPAGGYYQRRFTASFVGFFPAAAPEILVLISVTDPSGPRGEHTGGGVAAPIFKKVARQILGLRPELWAASDCGKASQYLTCVEVPDLSFLDLDIARELTEKDDLTLIRHGSGTVVYDQTPAPGTLVEPGDKIHVTVGPREDLKGATVIMPLLTGLSLRDAIRKATERGLSIRIDGTGRVVKQTPKSGSKAAIGDICRIVAVG